MDTDNDGKISKDEMNQHFDKLDTNNDGFISKDELVKQHKNR